MPHLTRRALPAAAFLAAMLAGAAGAQTTTVRVLHVEQNPTIVAYWNDIARAYESANPGTKVELQYLENEAYKKKLTTLLQSSDKPDIIYSWGGGVLREQVKAGVIEDLTPAMDADWRGRFIPAAVQAYTIDGKVYGVPMHTSQVGFFYNRDLFAKAGVDADGIKAWDDLLAAVKKLQAAGITPITAGGADKWPLHFYWTHLAVRLGGKPAFDAAIAGKGKGFADDTFVQAGAVFQQLVDLKPFQAGFLGTTYPQSSGQFGDGKAAMVLQGNFVLNSMRVNAADKKGLPDDKLGWFAFPTVPGGKGDPSDTLGGLNGWLVTKGAPKAAAGYLRFFSEAANQRIAAERGFYIPVVNGTQDAIANPFLRQIAQNVARSKYHQIFYDQALGPAVGATVNDVSTDIAAGRMKPAEAAEAVQQAWVLAN
ncbi:MAG: ABC transporter substrate-binding protein [Ferrovibrionaceae bacterium]